MIGILSNTNYFDQENSLSISRIILDILCKICNSKKIKIEKYLK